ncbi:PAS domain S-box protein [Tritonibacter mobilis]|nr:PAS domain S-box protein [Tritonibacter mobilis]
MHRWVISAAAVVLILLAAQAYRLGSDVQSRIEALSSAATDNLQWTLSQAEVDYLKYRSAAMVVEDRSDLPRLRRQFDIYYSRIATFRESALYSEVRATPEGSETLGRLQQGLQRQAALIDASDEVLLSEKDNLLQLIAVDGNDVRDLALFGVALQAETAGAERVLLHTLFTRLAIVVLALLGTLALTALVILRLFRRGQRLSMLQAQEAARTEAMVTSSLDAILMADAEGRITAINGAAEEIFGYSEEEAIGMNFDSLILQSPEGAEAGDLDNILNENDGRFQMTAQRKTGDVIPVEVSLTVSKSDGNQVLVSYVRDISHRLQAEEELRRARDDALAGEQAKDRLLTVMSHEMRTPLTGILGSLDVLEGLTPSAEQQRYLQAMRVSGELLLHHVNDVLQLSRLESGAEADAPIRFDLDELVRGIGESQQANAARNNNDLSVFCSLGAETGVEGHCRYVQQVLLNLIGNALKFTQDGAVSVDVMRTEGDLVEFSVADTGKGIAAEDLERIFDEFTMVDPNYNRGCEGTGLGLAISRRLARLMGERSPAKANRARAACLVSPFPCRPSLWNRASRCLPPMLQPASSAF